MQDSKQSLEGMN